MLNCFLQQIVTNLNLHTISTDNTAIIEHAPSTAPITAPVWVEQYMK